MDSGELRGWPEGTQFYQFEHLPPNPDYFLVSAAQLETLRDEWTKYVNSSPRRDHPNNFVHCRVCALDAIRHESCDVNLCIDQSMRYHGATKTLPRGQFVLCVHFPNFGKRPYLVVSRDWFESIEREAFSLYALVDAIGMRKLLDVQGAVTASQIGRLKDGIDAVARQHVRLVFLTFADNVLVKTNWTASRTDYGASYEPERFVRTVKEVGAVFTKELGLDAYAVVTQGANQVDDPSLVHVSDEGNHIMLPSLATPFVELFDIDSAARSAIREGRHPPKELYLSESLFLTLRFPLGTGKDRFRHALVPFTSRTTAPTRRSYLPVDHRELAQALQVDEDSAEGT